MKGRIFYSYLLVLLCVLGLASRGFGQTITSVSFSPSTVCTGDGITVTFTTSASFAAGNVFTAYLSDVIGGTYPTTLGTLTSRTGGSIVGKIPSNAVYGNGYRIQVRSSTGNPISIVSGSNTLTIGTPLPTVTNPAAFCEGTPQSLSANATGQNLKWYGTSQTGGTASLTPTTVTTAGTYYVSQTINGCESARAAITVTVKSKPGKPIANSPQTACANDTPKSLTALSDGGTNLYWYTDPTGGTGVNAAPKLSANSTYYVSQKNLTTGCESDRTTVVFTVVSLPKAPTVSTPAPTCAGNTITNFNAIPDAGGILHWWSDSNKTSAGPSTPSNTQSATYYVSQEVNGCDGPTAPISVTIIAKPEKPTVKAPAPVCSGYPVGSLTATASSAAYTLHWWGTSLSGGSFSTTAPQVSNTQTATYYVSQATKEGCESDRAGIPVTVNATPAAPTVTSPITACQTRSTDPLSATPSSGGTLIWYGTSANGGTPSSTAPPLSTVNTGSTTYYVSQSVSGCESARAAITVTVNAIPPPPTTSGQSVTYCEGAIPKELIATGSLLKWYGTNSSEGTASTNATIPSTAASAIGTNTYYVTQTISGCESSRTGIPVVVKSKPAIPGTANVAFCQGAASLTLTATPSPSGTLIWYGNSANGGIASSNPPVVSSATPGNNQYYVSQTVNGCESDRAGLSVAVKSTPNAPGVTSFSLCNNSPAQPLTANGTNLKWYDKDDKLLGSTYTPATSTVGPQIYKVSQTSDAGCVSSTASLTLTIIALPAPPTVSNVTYCQTQLDQPAQNVTSLAANANGQNLKWYTTTGTQLAGAPTPSIASSGIQSYQVSQVVSICESSKATIQVTVNTTNAPSLPKSLVTYCVNDKATPLQATAETGGQLRWIDLSGKTTNDAPTPSTANTNVQPGGDSFYVYQIGGANGCYSSRATIKVVVNPLPSTPQVSTTPISFCNNATAQPLTANGINLKWYDASDNSLNGTPTPNTGSVGNQTYKVSQTSSEGCEGPKATITVVINALPSQPTVAPVTYCQTQQDQPAQNVTSLQSNVSGQNLRWYNTDGNQFPNAPIPSIDKAGTQTFKVSQTVNNCESPKADLVVTINTTAAPITPKPVVVYCINDNATPLEAVGETGSQLRWVDPYGRVTTYAPTPATTNTNVQPGGDPFYVYQIGVNGCYSPRTLIKAVVTSPPTLGLTAPTTTVNLGQRAPLQLKFTSSGPFTYTLTGGYTGTSTKTDTTISVLPRGNTIYQVITVSNGCGVGLPGSPATAQINVIVPTVSTSSIATTTLCTGTSLAVPFTTSGQFNSGNVFRIELVSAIDTTKKYAVSATATSSPVTGTLPATLPGGQYLVRVKADNPEIAIIGSNSPTQLTIRSVASATLTGSQTIYEGTPANLTLTFGGDAPWTTTYADSLNNYSITTSTNPYFFEARPTKTTTYRLTNVTNVCGSGPISGTATIVVSPLLATDDNPLDPLIKTYPVPTQTILRVELDLPLTHTPATLSLIDAGGRPVLENSTRKQLNELDLTAQPNGLYFLRIQVGDRQTVRKIVKQ